MLRLTLDDSQPYRPQLRLTCGNHELRADAYYPSIDPLFSDHPPGKLQRVVARLVEGWLARLRGCPPQGAVYLPYDFTDQSSCWVRCERHADACTLQPGWSTYEGWKLTPSSPDTWPEEPPEFQPLEGVAPVAGAFSELLCDVAACVPASSMTPPPTDPTPIFELLRGVHASELLTAATCHFQVFDRLVRRPATREQLAAELGLSDRASHVLVTALRAMQLLRVDSAGRLSPSAAASEHLRSGQPFDVSDYLGLSADSPGVRQMVDQLRSSRPAGSEGQTPETGTAYIAREGAASQMDQDDSARRLTLALAGRARNCAPAMAAQVDVSSARRLLDVGGGSGLYSIALLCANPQLRATVFDRGPVLTVAREFAAEFGVADRLQTVAGDMFQDPWPACDVILLSNVLHDWDVPECVQLLRRCRDMLPRSGRLLLHDVLLNDALDGPLPVALYSARLFQLTEGRAYSRSEFTRMAEQAGFALGAPRPTLVHCHVLEARPV